jgi:hypothetical protein
MKLRSMFALAGLTAAALLGSAAPASADEVPTNCTNARQIGSTAYVKNNAGATLASVKQYYGVCAGTPKNWSYVYIWGSFFDNGTYYKFGASILSDSAGTRGYKENDRPAREITSYPAATTNDCTRAWGVVIVGGVSHTAATSEVC